MHETTGKGHPLMAYYKSDDCTHNPRTIDHHRGDPISGYRRRAVELKHSYSYLQLYSDSVRLCCWFAYPFAAVGSGTN